MVGMVSTGEFLYGRMPQAAGLAAVFVVSGGVLIYVMNTLWTDESFAIRDRRFGILDSG